MNNYKYFYFSYCPFYRYRQRTVQNHRLKYVRPNQNPVTVRTKEIKYSDRYIKEDLKIPVLQGINNIQVQNEINSAMENDIMEFKRQMEEAAYEYGKQAENEGKTFNPFNISSIYEITYNRNNIISISVLYHEYLFKAHSYIKATYNYNIVTGISLGLKDLFKSGVDYKEVINNEIRKELIANREKYLPETLEKFQGIAADQPFYIEDGNIVVFFGFNEIAPTEAKIPVIKIPFTSLKDSIKPMFLNRY